MKIFKRLTVLLLIISMLIGNVNFATSVTITNTAPISYIDQALSQKINSTRTVLEMKNMVNTYLEFPTITFGSYVQTALPLIRTPLEWVILEKRGNIAILMSKYVIDQTQYNTVDVPVIWTQSSYNYWLNTTFYNTTFSNNEKMSILQNNGNLGTVYALNVNEATYYYVDAAGRDFSATMTTAHANLVPSSNGNEKFGYWLRNENIGLAQNSSKVLFTGVRDAIDCSAVNTFGVRPVINVVFDPNISPYSPITPITPSPVPSPTPVPYTPEPYIDRSAAYEGTVFKNGQRRHTFTVSYYSDRVNSISGRVSVRVYLYIPKIGSNNLAKARAINNLLAFNALPLLKGYIRDLVENRHIVDSPIRISCKNLERYQDATVEIPFYLENEQICRLVVDIPNNQCNLEEG